MLSDPIVIISAKRTPMGHFNGVFKDISATQLGGYAIKSVGANMNVDAVIMGCVLSAGLGQAPARQAAIAAGIENTVPCTTINKMCGSGMQSIIMACREIESDHADIMIAGGMENMSRAPYLLPGARFGYRIGARIAQDHMMHDGLINAYGDHLSMGALAENCAKQFHITREAQDAFTLTSIERAIHATKSGFFKDEITPVENIIEDEGIQKAIPEKIPTLKPAFAKNGTITAANSSSISDGAAAILLMRASTAKKLQLSPLARIVADATAAQEPEWFSTAPITAIKKLLRKTGWKIEAVDLFEVNEAFAVVAMATMQALSISHDKINIHGGACILGHPIGASGARIVVTLIHALKRINKKRGIATLCIGGGEATAIAIET